MKRVLIALSLCLSLPVIAKEVATVKTQNEILMLDDRQSDCPAGAQVAVWSGRGKEPVPGCWFEAFGIVWVMFSDGDRVGLPRTAFKAPEEM
jgi:hypothetical protein